ncbi:peptidoglycan-binding protein [Nocardioides sp. Iso805N]|uniref:peptidoglycan-binding protein n=1 Tax=Nocardioides sp. Iso805N TaxID=1283287 RepID=UPI0003698FB9|nr:peptidoglycan-binding protein [Nocardioides sp. Iso805N]
MSSARSARRPAAKLLCAALMLTIAALSLGFVAGRMVKSPAQALAETAAPAPTVLTAPVTRQRVTRSVTFDATVTRRRVTQVPAPSVDAQSAVVTRLPARTGTRIRSGDLIAEISGRPVFVLPGVLPSYRTLTPGSRGPDVRQLQQGLAAAGYGVTVDGAYGAATAAAVDRLYRSHGYEPTVVGGDGVRSAVDAVRQAQRTLAETRASKADHSALSDARDDLSRAETALIAARAKAGAELPWGEVVFLPSLPGEVGALSVAVGDRVQDDLMTVTSGPLVVVGAPVAADARQIKTGDAARALLTPGGDVSGTVVGHRAMPVSDSDGGDQAAGSTVAFVIRLATPLKRRLAGSPARVVVTVASTPTPVLAVPLSAIESSANGSTSVAVVRGRRRITIPVTPGFSGDGVVEITPDAALSEGERIVVGTQDG